MFDIPPEPTKDEIDLLRKSILSKLENKCLLESLHPVDIKRIREDDRYLRRFLMHHDNNQKQAEDMAVATLKWRTEAKVNELTIESLDQTLLKNGCLDLHGRDADGCKMLLFSVRIHNKGVDPVKVKAIFIYWVERLEREETDKWISVVFDMRETGMRNMDMDFIQYMIHLFQDYYPWFLNYIIVFEMPWLLNAMWKIIKGWLPPKSVDKIKFVDKKSVQSFITVDQCLIGWGGTDTYEPTFTPEEIKTPEITMNGDIEVRKVHFAEGNSAVTTLSSKISDSAASKDSMKFKIDPTEELVFKGSKIGTNATIMLTNTFSTRYAFKIKTTSPEKYRVRPSIAIIETNSQLEVSVSLIEQLTPGVMVRDKFLIIALPCPIESISTSEFVQLQKKSDPLEIFEVRLRVGIVEPEVPQVVTTKPVSVIPLQLMMKVDDLLTNQKVLEEKISSLRRVVFIILFLMIALLFVFVMTTNNLTSSLLAQQTQASSCLLEKNNI